MCCLADVPGYSGQRPGRTHHTQKSSGVKSFVKITQGLKPHMGQ